MKKYLLLFLLLLPVAVSLYDLELYDGWVTSGTYFDIDGDTYRAIYIRNDNTSVFYLPYGVTAVIHLKNETCVREWLYEVCQEDIKFEKNGEEVPPTIHDKYINISMLVTITFSDVRLEVNRSFDKEELYLQENTDVRVDIIKHGKEDVTNITYIDRYNSDFVITPLSGCNRRGNNIIWKGDLNNSNRHVCIYNIRPVRETSFENNVTLSYTLLEKFREENYAKQFEVQETPLLFESSYREKAHTGDDVDFNLSLDVLKDIEIKELRITYPKIFTLKNKSKEFQTIENRLQCRDKLLEEDTEKDFFFILNTGHIGEHVVNLSLVYTYNNALKKINQLYKINYTGDIFHVTLLNATNRSIIRLSNPENILYERIQVFVGGHEFYLAKLEKRRFKEFGFPLMENGTHSVLVKFDSIYGQRVAETYHLEYGQSTYVTDEELEEQIVEPPEEETEERKWFDIDFNIDTKKIIVGVSVFGGSLLIIGIITLIKNKFSKSDIEKEIAELRKQEESLDEELQEETEEE